jgi:peptidoglycan/xylan/chitin deacetylase (PgdA/CDA1 family)
MSFLKPSRVPSIFTWLYPSWYLWSKPKGKKTIYLTFDDGPIPEVTDFVLDTLSRKRDKPIPATFFCIGDNVRKHPDVFKRILAEGHSIGNHTYNHLQGWKTDNDTYLKNTQLAELEMSKHIERNPDTLSSSLFRPPYGKIKRTQASALRKMGYKIVMYRVVAYDWESSLTPEACLHNVIDTAKDGDIIVFHDSVKAYKNLQYALPKVIEYFENAGFSFGKL